MDIPRMNLKEINFLLGILILISLIVFLVILLKYPYFEDCDLCRFEYKDKELKLGEIWKLYRQECLRNFIYGEHALRIPNLSG